MKLLGLYVFAMLVCVPILAWGLIVSTIGNARKARYQKHLRDRETARKKAKKKGGK